LPTVTLPLAFGLVLILGAIFGWKLPGTLPQVSVDDGARGVRLLHAMARPWLG
jgi:hypothetical protein